jgi:hypothetical protein
VTNLLTLVENLKPPRHAARNLFEVAIPRRAVVCRRNGCCGYRRGYFRGWQLSVALGILLLLTQRLLSCSSHCLYLISRV